MSSPKRKSLPAGYEINPATGRKRKVCPPGKVRSPGRSHCISSGARKNKRKSPKRKSLPAGYEINQRTGRRRKVCPPGKVRSQRGNCVKDRSIWGANDRTSPSYRPPSPARMTKSKSKSKSKSPRRKRKSPKKDDCCVCLDETTTGVSSCNHPLCRGCLGGMKRSGRTVKCPLCRGPCRSVKKLR